MSYTAEKEANGSVGFFSLQQHWTFPSPAVVSNPALP